MGAPFLGGIQTLEVVLSGLTNGLPLSLHETRRLQASFGSIINILPIASTVKNDPKHNEAILSITYKAKAPSMQPTVKNYTRTDVQSGKLFRELSAVDDLVKEQDHVRTRFYVNDETMDSFTPMERPPISDVFVVYGIGVPVSYSTRK